MTVRKIVFDSYALLAFFEGEPAGQHTVGWLKAASRGQASISLSLINWGEVFYTLARSKGRKTAEACLLHVERLPVNVTGVSPKTVLIAAEFKSRFAVAYADCFAAALAREEQCPVLTGDPEFKKLSKDIKIEWMT